MKGILTVLLLLTLDLSSFAQRLKLPLRKANALTGSAFAHSIADSLLSLTDRENLIYREIKNGNVPNFLRKLSSIEHDLMIDNEKRRIIFFAVPDYIAIGSDADYFYVPMTPILAQKVANLLSCVLPTKKMVDLIYEQSTIKLSPSPIPPTKAMTTVPVFLKHSLTVQTQLIPFTAQHADGQLTAGHKKDIIISTKIYTEKAEKVVIYGWHQINGKVIQPVYNKHANTWADYSHGARFIKNRVKVNGKKMTVEEILSSHLLHPLLSDEGVIVKAFYP